MGSPERWPQQLRTLISPLLVSRLPFLILWGLDLVMLYNEAYALLIGDKHPSALGRPAREVFPEIWDVIGPMFERVLRGESTSSEDQLLKLQRHGFPEECYFTFSYSPIRDEHGQITGVLTLAVLETTQTVLSQRRLRLLREIGGQVPMLAAGKNVEEICKWSVETITSDVFDISFALLYLLKPDQKRATLCASAGLGGAAAPKTIDWGRDNSSLFWPIREVIDARTPSTAALPSELSLVSPWGLPLDSAYVMPINSADGPVAVLIAGLSPHLPFDLSYRGFLESISADLGIALSNARNYQVLEETRERLSIATTAAEFGVFDWDADSDSNTHDQRFSEIFGLAAGNAGMTFEQFSSMMEPDDRAAYRKTLAAALQDGSLHSAMRFRRPDGQWRWMEIHGKTIPASGDHGRRIIGVVRDITERKHDEDRLRASEARYRTLVDASPDGILINRDNRVVFANRAFTEMIGAQAYTELLGRDPFEFLHPDFHPALRERITRLLDTGEPNPPLEQKLIRLDGKSSMSKRSAPSTTLLKAGRCS